MGKAIAILADILQSSNLDNSAIERERQVILREMQEVKSYAQPTYVLCTGHSSLCVYLKR